VSDGDRTRDFRSHSGRRNDRDGPDNLPRRLTAATDRRERTGNGSLTRREDAERKEEGTRRVTIGIVARGSRRELEDVRLGNLAAEPASAGACSAVRT